MLKSYLKELAMGCGAGAIVFLLATLIFPEIFEINFFRMLMLMLIINATTGFLFYSVKLVSSSALINGVLQCSVMILTAVVLPMVFGLFEFNIYRIIWTVLAIGASYALALLVYYRICKLNLEKINAKLSQNFEENNE